MIKESKLRFQFKQLQSIFLKVYVPTLVFLGFIWLITKITPETAYTLTADPAEITGKPPYIGIVSSIGILLWSATVAICWFSATVIKKDTQNANRWKSFFVFSGIVSAVLLFDDLLEIHEQGPKLIKFISKDEAELVIFAIYAFLLLIYFVKSKKLFLQTNLLPLLSALVFISLSLVIDMNSEIINSAESSRSILLEEGAKLLGIASWLDYFTLTCYSRLK